MKGYRAKTPGPNGKRRIVFNIKDGYIDLPVTVPCGQCVGCRLEKSRQWAIRCLHEAQLNDDNCFVTLTYNDANLPADMSVHVREHQLFMKRLRKEYGEGIRFFLCGEYGDLNHRPHYHALLFGLDFKDKIPYKQTPQGEMLYTSPSLERVWGKGFAPIGEVTFSSAAYVARYVMKKRTGEGAEKHYEFVDNDGVVHQRLPEYVAMSRGCKKLGTGGIGKGWFDKYKSDVYPDDFVVVNGKKMRAPKYYDQVLEREEAALHRDMKRRRVVNSRRHASNNTRDRLRVREIIQLRKLERLKREV